ncbi:HD domain-containing protein [Podospora appendiculata]|uniref:5'-deoxynucleotidase n=1 Tax=Podospora appendiculata TaxID=314037 RepID=A0AAE1CBQ1_9PEZI|nr:HD domain-containing protein [Podospora appendiculata]
MSPNSSADNAHGNGSVDDQHVPDVATVVNPNPEITGEWTIEKVLDTIPTGKPVEQSSSPLAYFHILERLKTMKREGWRRFGIQGGESISDHMYRMSMMSMFAPPALAAKLDMQKCMKMCLIHDMAESIVGDITPVDGVAKPEKSRREAATMDYITTGLLGKVDGGIVGTEIRAIWQEYEDSKTLESHYVHDIDKVELLLQMVEYEKRGKGKLDLGEFAYVKTKIVLDEVKAWADELIKDREAFWDGHSHVDGEAGVAGGVAPEKRSMQDEYYSGHGKQEQ